MFQNTLSKAVAIMNLAGICVDSKRTENDKFIEYHIKVPKAEVCVQSKEPQRNPQTKLSSF